MQSIIHVTVQLELLAWGEIPLAIASALATPICMLMPFYQSPHYSKWIICINDGFMQYIIHVSIQLEHLAQGKIPLDMALALAMSISMLSVMAMPFHWFLHYSKWIIHMK
jgi:hypothetical protein